MTDTFEKALGINPVVKKTDITPVQTQEIIPPAQPAIEVEESVLPKDALEDYDLSRDTFRTLINKGNGAIDGITELAKLTDNPEAYKVIAALIKTVSDTTKDLYDLHKKTKDLKSLDGTGKKILDNGNVNIDKAVFVGTTTDLLQSLKDKEKNG